MVWSHLRASKGMSDNLARLRHVSSEGALHSPVELASCFVAAMNKGDVCDPYCLAPRCALGCFCCCLGGGVVRE